MQIKKKIKILVLDITLKGGIERFVTNMANSFVRRGFDVDVYSFHRSNERLLYCFLPEVNVIYLTKYSFRRVLYKFISLLCCLKLAWLHRSCEKELVFISTSPIITIFLSWVNKKLLAKTIASEHSTYSTHAKWIRDLRLKNYRGVKSVVTQTDDGAKRFLAAGLKTKRIPNACTDFNDQHQWNVNARSSVNPFICLSVGRFEEVKQFDHYVDAAKIIHDRYPNIKFKLLGAGPLENRIRDKISSCNLQDVFKIYAPTPHVNKFYARASAYFITSKSEAFPMTMLEALSYGLPIISYDRLIGPAEVLINRVNGFLCRQDEPEEIAAKVINLYEDQVLLESIKKAALLTAELFKEDEIMRQWVSIVQD